MSKITKKDLNERLLMVETLLGLHLVLPEQISNEQATNAIFRMQCALSSGKEIAGRNPTELEQRIEALEEFATYADNMLTELNHALPDPEYDAKCEAQEADIDASLDRHRERLGLNKPQLKQLDQSVFDGLDEKWRFATISSAGRVYTYDYRPTGRAYLTDSSTAQLIANGQVMALNLHDYDASSWQDSLIERDTAKELLEVDLSSELTGSDYYYSNITSSLLESGSKLVVCFVSNVSESDALSEKHIEVIIGLDVEFNDSDNYGWQYAIPINNQGEPLTASEVGL